MHGIKKRIKSSDEVEKERKQNELKKIERYKILSQQIMENKKLQIYDKNTLNLTTELLEMNTEFYTLWNYRRQIFQKIEKEIPKEEMKIIYENELKFIEKSIAMNPKSYWVWLHRIWVTSQIKDSCDWFRELKLCGKLLDLDERNFHCWNYRRYVSKQAKLSLQDEFDFTTKKIEDNFSNYSAWHQRSAILPFLFKDDEEGFQKALENEFELVKNAFYTEPNDSSAWFYHQWLTEKICQFQNKNQKLILERELNMCKELLEHEPNSKWPIITSIFLMSKLGGYERSILQNLYLLCHIDSDHINYYKYLAKNILEQSLKEENLDSLIENLEKHLKEFIEKKNQQNYTYQKYIKNL
jgi:geranylgeranyl transferase type-2 subunit alpha